MNHGLPYIYLEFQQIDRPGYSCANAKGKPNVSLPLGNGTAMIFPGFPGSSLTRNGTGAMP